MPTIVGVVPSPGDAESAVNNLTEAGIHERAISLVTANQDDARAVIDDGGPLAGVTVRTLADHLTHLGLSSATAASYAGRVEEGNALLAVHAPPQGAQSVAQSLRDAGADETVTLP